MGGSTSAAGKVHSTEQRNADATVCASNGDNSCATRGIKPGAVMAIAFDMSERLTERERE
jgi:hypothetical protein